MSNRMGKTVAMAALAMIAAAWLFVSPAKAQYVCPSGPGPGERQVGQTPSGQGVAGAPLCVRDYWPEQQQQSYPSYQAPVQLPNAFAAFAIDMDTTNLSWGTFYDSFDEAYEGALGACRKGGGKNCKTLDGFSNQCSAVALDGEGYIFQGMDVLADRAQHEAMESCMAKGRPGFCRLKTTAVCSNYSSTTGTADLSNSFNKRAASADEAFIESESARYDRRDYWGAFIQDGTQVGFAMNRLSKDSAISDAMSQCKSGNCPTLATFKNSCATYANPVDAKGMGITGTYYPGIDADPKRAYSRAIDSCKAKTGGNCAAGAPLCSGRAYIGYKWDGAQ